MLISILLLTGKQQIGYLISFLAPILIVLSLWFWVDINEELDDLPSQSALPLTVRIWRWCMTFLNIFYGFMSFLSLSCMNSTNSLICSPWLEAPQSLHGVVQMIFNFLFGADWTVSLAGFVGYMTLIAYLVGLIQWFLIRLPKQGRIAGEF